MRQLTKQLLIICQCFISASAFAQSDSLLNQLGQDDPQHKEYITNAFKSSRVVNNQSIEMIGKGVLDLRILHRFGLLNSGAKNLYGLDQASFRLGFDYGITKNLTAGIGRSTFQKELDGLIKWRFIQQSTGYYASPVSVVWVSGITVNTTPAPVGEKSKSASDRSGYYHELIVGRKFSEKISFQLNPIMVHRNRITPASADDKNTVYAVGAGFRMKLSKRIAFVADYDYVVSGLDKNIYVNPLAVGIDIETGGHVFQLHFSNTVGMNENAFLTHTTNKWGKGEINFGFNLSRVFSIKKKKI
jgi:opacity protein-like surface antigen